MIKKWYDEAVNNQAYTHQNKDFTEVFYKGFKFIKNDSDIFILYLRKSDFYTEITKQNMDDFNNKGFIRAVDEYTYKRNIKRTRKCKRRLEKLFKKKSGFKSPASRSTDTFRSLCASINKYVDMLQFYTVKMIQHELKYKLNE